MGYDAVSNGKSHILEELAASLFRVLEDRESEH